MADELLAVVLDADPVAGTLRGDHRRDHRLPDPSAGTEWALRERAERLRVRALAVDTEHAGLQDRLTVAVVVQQARALVDRFDALAPEYTVIGNVFAPVPGLLFDLGRIAPQDDEQVAGWLARLRGFGWFTEATARRHRAGIAVGRVPVRHLVDDAIEHVDRYLADPAIDPLLAVPLPAAVEQRRRQLVAEVVHPALARYRDVLRTEIAPVSRHPERAGLCWLPGGGDIYRGLIRAHLNDDRDPAELHETGRQHLARLRPEIVRLGGGEPAEVFRRLRDDPDLRWRDADELLDTTRAAVRRAAAAAPGWFGAVPEEPCEVRPVPPADAVSAPIGFYLAPPDDGSRPGTYFANTHRAEQRPRYTAEVVAFHEALPGHHLQFARAMQVSELPALRRLLGFTAYTEGWGLYAERLADEMGLYSDEVQRLGMVAQDALRGARLVVDTGLHEMGWSRQRAVDCVLENTALPPIEAESEVDRYIAFPAQALSYLAGRRELDRIRATAQRRMGERFDIARFHDLVLGNGSLPLSAVDSLVRHELV
nr:DUF885 domain-containing protein [Saccharopolyspora sp. HNM0983]